VTCARAGVLVALDDFGIGFSNLSQLSRLPLDILKVDRSLVQRPRRRPARRRHRARDRWHGPCACSCRVVAEGIETPAQQRDHLHALGCDCGQGYLLGRPMAAGDIAAHARPEAELAAAL
jgi:EAL domain-containing protein (putative c-di-GMP-specific phosphodiesterase class I)